MSVLLLLVACSQKPERDAKSTGASSDDSIHLEIFSAMDAEGQFRLTNRSSKPIIFNSTQETPDGAHAQEARLKCKPAGADEWDEGPRPMADSPASPIEVSPGAEQTVIVLWEPGLLQHYADGSCLLELRLQDGSIVHSEEFTL